MVKEIISVITVSKNAMKTIANTIESVLAQTYPNIEYIFVDGESSDSTNRIIEEYKNPLFERGIRVIHISEPDYGIYYAMNKGIELATGDWVYFLNADDRLADDTVLEKIMQVEDREEYECIYGNTINFIDGKKFIRKGLPLDVIFYRMPFGHQALFVRKETVLKYRFDTTWPRLADFDQFLRMYLNGENFRYVDINVAEFNLTGVSQRNMIGIVIERERIQRKNNVVHKCRLKRFFRNICVIVIKDNKLLYKKYVDFMGKTQALTVKN